MDYWISRDGQQFGPYAKADLAEWVQSGQVSVDDMAWHEGREDWIGLGTLLGSTDDRAIDAPVAAPPPPPAMPPTAAAAGAGGLRVTRVRDGQLSAIGDYGRTFALVEAAMLGYGAKIKERSPERGLLVGTSKYGINAFGITITCTFHGDSAVTNVEIAANLTDAFDTFGACGKRVTELTDRIMREAAGQPGAAPHIAAPAYAAAPVQAAPAAPPAFADRAGPSYKGMAITGLVLGVVGLFIFPILGIGGGLMCAKVLYDQGKTTNKDGRGIAIAGVVMGVVSLLWIFVSAAIRAA